MLVLTMTTSYVKQHLVKSLSINDQKVLCEFKCQATSMMETPRVKRHSVKYVVTIVQQYLIMASDQRIFSRASSVKKIHVLDEVLNQ